MHSACATVGRVAHIQIRNVPPDVHRTLKERAAKKGMSLSEYLLQEVTELAGQPTDEEFFAELRRHPPVELSEDPADTIRRIRDAS
jgi:plasmid stability protein